MKILYFNWVQFDNPNSNGGGVNVYQRNIIEFLIKNTTHDISFLSSGVKYDPLHTDPYIRETDNCFNGKCKTWEIINSPIMAPAFTVFMNPSQTFNDCVCERLFDNFLEGQGGFDVIHFNNIEGISINVLRLKEKYPQTKFVVSIHNYQTICPLCQYFQNHNMQICYDFKNGNECMLCCEKLPRKKEYCHRVVDFYKDKTCARKQFYKPLIKLFSKIFLYKAKKYIGSPKNMQPQYFKFYREHNINILNSYADIILAVSERVRNIMINHGINEKKIVTSYIGTKFADNPQQKLYKNNHTGILTIGYLGYKRFDKGFYFFIDSLSKINKEIARKINVVLAVKKIKAKEYKEKLKFFNKIIVYDGFTHANLKKILEPVDLGVIPVLWEDNLPQIAIEIVAAGVPILCSDFGGASELCCSPLFKHKGGSEEDFINKITSFVCDPGLLDKYWEYHVGLTTMQKHIRELEYFYSV